jgi:TM2 domain-containing membrane protein YozV
MSQSNEWYYAQGEQQFGPVSFGELCELANNSRIHPSDLVWTNGLLDWTPAGHIAGLIVRFEGVKSQPKQNPNWPPPNFKAWMNAMYHAVTQASSDVPPHAVGPTDPTHVNRMLVGVIALFLGCLGIHKFLLGRTGPGLVMLLTTLCTFGFGAFIMAPIGLVEGILYLNRTDDDFQRIYLVGKKAWF